MSEQNSNPLQDAAPEEIEAAMAANAADELQRLQAELAELKAKSAELADQFLRAKAEAENVRRRAKTKSPRRANSASRALPKAFCLSATAWMPPWPFNRPRRNSCAKVPTPRCAS